MSSKKKNWFFLFTSNFWGVLNDNFMKHCIIFIGIAWLLPSYLSQSMLISLVSVALIIPYLLLSPLGGRLAITHSKRKIFLYSKLAEFPIVFLAILGFYLQNVWIALAAVLLMGIQSCLYSPSKYGLIRDVGGEDGLSFGSGIFETMAFLGILGGTLVASLVADNYSFYFVAGLLLAFALLGYISVRNIKANELPTENQVNTSINPMKFMKESFLFAGKYPYINCGILGVSVFWLLGGLLQMNLVIHCKETLQTNNTTAGLVMAAAAVGIALGCSFAGRFSNKTINTRMIFVGLAGMIIFLSAIVVFNPPVVICAILIFLTAFSGGFFEVPCLALVQKANIGRKAGDMLAYMNIVTFIFVLLGSVIFSVSTYFSNENSLIVFAVIIGICLLTLAYFFIRHPHFLKNKIE